MSRLRKEVGQLVLDADCRSLEMARTFVTVEHGDFFSIYFKSGIESQLDDIGHVSWEKDTQETYSEDEMRKKGR